MLFALSSGHKIGLGLAAAAFIAFALASSFLFPRYRPQFPGKALPLFLGATVLLFVGMLAAVEIFGGEPTEAAAEGKTGAATFAETGNPTVPATTNAGNAARTIAVTETEWKVELATARLTPGSYVFRLKNDGKIAHNLTISGPQVNNSATPTIGPGKTAELRAALGKGTYDLYCSVPGHKGLGMDLKVTVS